MPRRSSQTTAAFASLLISQFYALTSFADSPFGGFAPQSMFVVGRGGGAIAMADFNNDGFVDLVVANDFDDTMSVLLGLGNGQFTPPLDIEVDEEPYAVAAADFDRDGNQDFAVGPLREEHVSIFLGNGNATFVHVHDIPISDAARSLVVDDFNLDGVPDLAAVVAFYGGSGGLITEHAGPDGDGERGPDPEGVVILLGVGDGNFQPMPTTPAGLAPRSLAASDFNGDGAADLVIGSLAGKSISILLGDGLGGLSVQRLFFAGPGPMWVTAGDFDGDGFSDVAAISFGESVAVLRGNGDGTFEQPQFWPVGPASSHIATDDLDGDGDLDLTTVDFNGDSVSVLLGDGGGGFAPAQQFEVGDSPLWATIGDLNADGAPDVVAHNLESSVSVLLNQSILAPPGAFALLSPPDGASGLALPQVLASWPDGADIAKLDWSTSEGFRNSYHVVVATDHLLEDIVLEVSGLNQSEMTFPIAALAPNQTYFWAVTAMNQFGETPSESGVFSFSTASAADLNWDGVVNGDDLAALLASWSVPN